MASELRVTTIANNAGSESVNTTYVVNGSLKAWVGAETDASQQQSLNFSSSSDNGTGSYTHTLTNAASQDLEDSGLQVSAGGGTRFARYAAGTTTTSVVDFRIHDTSGNATDGQHNINFAGDLA